SAENDDAAERSGAERQTVSQDWTKIDRVAIEPEEKRRLDIGTRQRRTGGHDATRRQARRRRSWSASERASGAVEKRMQSGSEKAVAAAR
ncbi:MAG: hypothetical protein GY854_08040, partial [Deltaproteobacteria bacterium]|nr:hypothetical protein [Deltaproteobacteria bacterium]